MDFIEKVKLKPCSKCGSNDVSGVFSVSGKTVKCSNCQHSALFDEWQTTKVEIKTGDSTITYDDSQEVRDAVFDAVINYYKDYGCFCGESIMQSDEPMIEATSVLASIADDIIKFERECDDEC